MSNAPEEGNELQGFQVYTLLSSLRGKGIPLSEIRQQLVEKGVSPDEASRLTDRVALQERKEKLQARARTLLSRGIPHEEIQRKLLAEGHDQETINVVVHDLSPAQQESTDDKRYVRYLGVLCIVAGFGFAFANLSGSFPTFSSIMIGIGSLVLAIRRD
jgi:DNA-binding transcriptional MerR regulator